MGEYCRTYCRPETSSYPFNQSKRERLERINDNFMGMLETDPEFHGARGLFSWMRSYFDDCPDSLKPCIFYLSVFPLGHQIRIKCLLRRWIAEGYSRDTPGSTGKENGEKFFSDLVKLSIIQQQESASKQGVCQVNGFFREYIISQPMQDNLVFALEGRCVLNSQYAGQHLSISSSWDRDKILFESMELSRLRSLTVFGKWSPFFISGNVNMRLLRVLDMEETSGLTDGDIEEVGKLLPRLKFLSLRGCTGITCLPSSLGGLRQLQTLDIKGTSIVTLPLATVKLKKLQYVRAGTTLCLTASTEDKNGKGASVATPPRANDDGVSTSQPQVAASTTATQTPALVDGEGASTSQPPKTAVAADDGGQASTKLSSRTQGGLVFSWLSKFQRHRLVSSTHHGVQFPAAASMGIGKLTTLHTLGVINVGGASGNTVVRELEKLTQLRKLRLSGINRKNWKNFCCTISCLVYLESLSVQINDDGPQNHLCCLCDISNPPKTLRSLKLYGGNVHVSVVWMNQLHSLRKAHLEDLELTISTQEDIDSLRKVRCLNMFRHHCVKPVQDGELRFGWVHGHDAADLKIDCRSYSSEIVFEERMSFPEVLVVHCSTTEASLEVSGLKNLWALKEVWLKGAYSDAIKQHLHQKVEEHENKPVLMLDPQQPGPPTPCLCLKRLLR